MQQQAPVRAYGITKVEYARMVREAEARQAYQPGEGFFTRLKKRFR
jgi:hypothetical protein